MSCVRHVCVSHVSPKGVRNSLHFSWVCLPRRNSSMDRHREVGRQNGCSGARRKTLPAPHRHQELWGVSKGFLWLLVLVYMAAGAPQEVPGAQAESGETCTPHARKHKIPCVGLGLRRLQSPHSVLGLPRHKAQVEPGTAGFLQSHWLCSGHTHTAREGRTGRCPALPTTSTAKEEQSSRLGQS